MRYITFLILIITISLGQIQYGGVPKYEPKNNNINFINTDNLEIIDRDLHPMVLKYADEYYVDINFLTEATKIVNIYETIFYLGIESKNAKALAFVFDDFNLTENSKMFIYSEDESMYIGSFNSKNNNPSGELATAVVKGDRVVIELTVPNHEIDELSLNMVLYFMIFLI